MTTVDRARLAALHARERAAFSEARPRSRALAEQAAAHMPGGVPMSWMVKWPGDFPVFVEHAEGAHFTCVDGIDHVDLCLGDTGAMMGHSPAPTVEAVTRQLSRGITTMLPTEDAIAVSTGLAERFGLPYWQFALTATDANSIAKNTISRATSTDGCRMPENTRSTPSTAGSPSTPAASSSFCASDAPNRAK